MKKSNNLSTNILIKIGGNIVLENFIIFGDKKVEIVLSTKNHMASLSILDDFTYDLMVIKLENEKIVISKTNYCGNLKILLEEIKTGIKFLEN